MQLPRLVTMAVALIGMAAGAGRAEPREDLSIYMFANSLVHYLSDDPHTNVPYWLHSLAQADGRGFAVDGQWGTLRDFTRSLPPAPNWSIDGVRSAIPRGRDFAGAGLDLVLINPTNFIQYQAPDRPFDGDNPDGSTPVSVTLDLLDWVAGAAPDADVVLYEGWADMAGQIRGFPPSARQLAKYHAFNRDAYHDWYVDYAAQLSRLRPDMTITLVPVASTLSMLMSSGPLADLEASVFYSDDAPHGTASLYFLAAMVTYASLYEAPPPADFAVPDSLHPLVAAQYGALRDRIWDRIAPTLGRGPETLPRSKRASVAPVAADEPAGAKVMPAGSSASSPSPTPTTVAVTQTPAIPVLAMGLNGLSDWSTQHPFLDLMKSARPWIGHLPDQWGGMDAEDLRAGGHLSPEGWPLRIPPGVDRLEALLLTDQPPEAKHLHGDYVLTYDGQGDVALTGRASRVHRTPGRITFRYHPGEGLVGVSLSTIDRADPVRNIVILRQNMVPLHEAGVIFNPDWIARVSDLRAVRFMDWMFTNGAPVEGWQDRPRPTDYTYVWRGAPLPVMVSLANQIGADPWFTMPHMANDAYVTAFATEVRDTLDPRLKAHVEYSNEVWNFIFPQAHWAADQARMRWGESETGWMQFYGLRAAQVMDLWAGVFGSQTEARLVRVVSTHTGWAGLEESILQAPLAYLELGRMPQDSFDAYAVSGYFGHDIGGPENAVRLLNWLDDSEARAIRAGESLGLRRVALREHVRAHRFDAAIAPAIAALRDGSVMELASEIWPYHAQVAQKAGLDLVMYEGGSHVAAQGDLVNDDRVTAFFAMLAYTPEMAALYHEALTAWTGSGGRMFNAFVDVAAPGQWGSWGALRHLDDANPRWDILMAYNATPQGNPDRRDPAAFADGRFLRTTSAAVLTGTPQEDILIGGPENDTFLAAGGDDHLHGGPGQDRAILHGVAADYTITQKDRRSIARGPHGTVILIDIETIDFDGALRPDAL